MTRSWILGKGGTVIIGGHREVSRDGAMELSIWDLVWLVRLGERVILIGSVNTGFLSSLIPSELLDRESIESRPSFLLDVWMKVSDFFWVRLSKHGLLRTEDGAAPVGIEEIGGEIAKKRSKLELEVIYSTNYDLKCDDTYVVLYWENFSASVKILWVLFFFFGKNQK